MNATTKFEFPLSNALGSWCHGLWLRYYFKFVLPKIDSTTIDGIRLDLSSFSPRIRNRILMGYEEAEKRLCRELLSPNDSVIEIGAAIGFIGLFCTKRLGITNYQSIEANTDTIELLKRNYQLNGVIPQVSNFAVGPEDGFVELQTGDDFWGHSIVKKNGGSTAQSIRVPSVTISSLFKKLGHPSALIIDIEGAERSINFSALPAETNKLIMELHPHVIGKPGVNKILMELKGAGFRIVDEQDDTVALLREGSPENKS